MHVSSSLPSTERMRGEGLGSKEIAEEEMVEEGTCTYEIGYINICGTENVFLQLKLLHVYLFFRFSLVIALFLHCAQNRRGSSLSVIF